MGNRLTKIYTRTGDDGTTGLASGERVAKSDLVFEVMGDVDELNAHIGMISAQLNQLDNQTTSSASKGLNSKNSSNHIDNGHDNDVINKGNPIKKLNKSLAIIQHLLFNVGGELAMPEYKGISNQHVHWLETNIDTLNATLEPLKDFILPAGSVLVSSVHIARTVCRRAERQAVRLTTQSPSLLSKDSLMLLNRLSDWLFVLARYCANIERSGEVLWDKAILDAKF